MSEDWVQRFEQKLEQLEQTAAEEGATLEKLLSTADAGLRCLAKLESTNLWLVRPDAVDCLSGQVQSDTKQNAVVQDACSKSLSFVESASDSEQLLVTRPVANQMTCVLQAEFSNAIAPRSGFGEGALAVLDVLVGFVSRHLLSQYETRFQSQVTMVDLVSRLHRSNTFREAASVVVQDGAPVIGDCRLSVVSRQTHPHSVIAITGVKEPKPEAEAVRAICRITASDDLPQLSAWCELSDRSCAPESDAYSVLMQNNVRAIRILPLVGDVSAQAGDIAPMLVMELYNEKARPEEASVQQLVNVAAPVLLKLQHQEQTFFSRMISSRRLRRIAWGLLAMLLLALIPWSFEVEVPGQMNSTDRRRIFAPEHGTIDKVLFQNEGAVEAGDVLLRMSNPDLDLEQRRIQGEIDTTATKLASVQTRRLTGDPSLSGDEKQLEQQLKNLTQQLALVDQQIASLTITAPFAGTAFRRDAQRDLVSRPVQRGQLLLELVPENSQWQLELKIPDRLRGYVVKYRDVSDEPQQIRYLVVSTPEQDWTTGLTSVDNAIQVEDGKMVCRATAELSELPEVDLRPGTSVMARIQCGRRSLGFVMFREVVEFWYQFKFAWL